MNAWLRLALFVSLLTPTALHAQVTPSKALETFKVSSGLDLQLWAAEPLFVNPTCMDLDHKGRVWVVESINYRCTLHRQPLREPRGDRILILEDTRGTGKANRVTVFYQAPEILAPLSIAVAPHTNGVGVTVYVAQSPDILVFEDKDGTGAADGPPRKLLSGFKGIDHDHGVHGLVIGPDNKLYFTVGDQGVSGLVDKNGKKWSTNNTDCRAGTVWRCDLDGKNLELLAHNFRNHYEPCVDSFGTIFVSDNDDDGQDMTRICYVMPGGNYGYHPRGPGQSHWHENQPGVVPMLLRTFRGSPTGMCFYEGQLLPEKYWGNPLHVDAGPGRLSCYHLSTKGASYAIERADMVTSSDKWYRPSDVCIAPDGAVFVADWYDPGVGGHGMGDVTRGRVYRLAPTGNKPTIPKVDLASNEGILAALGSANLAVRHMAMAKLNEIGQLKAVEVLTKGAIQKKDPILRARVLWQLGRLGNLKFVTTAFSDPDPRFRILAMRIFSDFHNLSPADYIPDWREALAGDASAAVRREALLLLRDADPAKAKPLIYKLARSWDGKDRFYLEALGIAVGQNASRRDVLLADFDKHFPAWDAKMPGLLWELRPPQALKVIGKHVSDDKIPLPQRLQIVDVLAANTDAAAGEIVLSALLIEKTPDVRERMAAAIKQNLRSSWKKLDKASELSQAIAKFSARPETLQTALELMAAPLHDDYVAGAITISEDTRQTVDVRLAALRVYASYAGEQTRKNLHRLLDADPPPELAVEALLSLGRLGEVKRLELVAVDATNGLAQRQAAVAGLAGTKTGSNWLLEAHAQKNLADDLGADLARLLRYSPFPDIRQHAEKVFKAPPPLDPKKLPSIPALLTRKGNVERGKQLIAASLTSDAQCLKCHTINGIGGKVGPDLSTIGSKASRENLLESILYPSRAIADQYQQYQIETKSGLLINGLLIEETADHILVRDANAKDYKIAQKEVEARKKVPTSLMPELIQNLKDAEQDLLDMVDYLSTLKNQPLPPGVSLPNEARASQPVWGKSNSSRDAVHQEAWLATSSRMLTQFRGAGQDAAQL
jgi:putative membrane-bound dehydrogenase-like protein